MSCTRDNKVVAYTVLSERTSLTIPCESSRPTSERRKVVVVEVTICYSAGLVTAIGWDRRNQSKIFTNSHNAGLWSRTVCTGAYPTGGSHGVISEQ